MKKKRCLILSLFLLSGMMVFFSCSHSLKSTKQKGNVFENNDKNSQAGFSENNDLFASVDTTDEAVFTEAELIESLAQKADEALKPVYFEYNSFQLGEEAIDILIKISEFLKSNSGIRILVQGHCDNRGSSEYNMGLGENRAKVIKDYLVNSGINSIRIETTSYGKEKPAVMNCSDEQCHSRNRRCEFIPLMR